MVPNGFTWGEYAAFILMTVACFGIPIYFNIKDKANRRDHVWGGGMLGIWPMTMSLVATSLSSVSFGFSNEVYQYGGHISLDLIGVLVMTAVNWLLVPTLYPLKLPSINAYGTLRFSKWVKIILCVNTLSNITFATTIMAYSTSLFISQISGLAQMTCFLLVVGTSYILATIGGFKGVVWSDALQAAAMLVSVIILAVIGARAIGGLDVVLQDAIRGDRLIFDFSLDPTKRLTVWSTLAMVALQCTASYSVANPTIYQRYAALRTEKQAKKVVIFHSAGIVAIKSFIIFLGFVIYSTFKDCDPVLSGRVLKYDQVLAYFIQSAGQKARLATVAYIIGYVSAAVSTLSSLINTFGVLLFEALDRKNMENGAIRGRTVIPLLSLALVVTNTLVVQILQHLGNVLDLAIITSIPAAISSSIILIGVFLPWIGSKAVVCGSLFGGVISLWMAIGNKAMVSKGRINYPVRTMSVTGCINSTTITRLNETQYEDVFIAYKITSFLHPAICFILILVVASITTLITGTRHSKALDERLIFTKFRRFLSTGNGRKEEILLAETTTRVLDRK